MSLATDEQQASRAAQPEAVPARILKRIERGRAAMKKDAPKRKLFYKFWRGDSYAFINRRGLVDSQSTMHLNPGDKPNWRIRNKYPFIAMIVGAKVSGATQRVPSYEIAPSTTTIEAAQAASLAERVSLYGYDKWLLRRRTTQLVEHALVGGEGFAYPHWDATVGPYIETSDPLTGAVQRLGQGEVRVAILSANEVYWEPGCDFVDSRWYVVERAMPLDVIREMPDYIQGELKPDATDSESPSEPSGENLANVSEYLERPSAKNPDGQRIVMANNRRIVPDESYPCRNAKDETLDEPVLVRLSYVVESNDRDRGLVEMLVDLQRTIQDCWNKILEYKNRGLNLQMTVPRGSNMARRDDQPGATWFYNPVGGQGPQWEPPPSPQHLSNLLAILDKSIEHLRALSADVDVQPDPRLTAQTAQQAIEQAQLRWQSFLGDLAEAHSRIMHLCLYLVQRHYSEERDLKIMGTNGPDYLPGFLGADLLGESDVRVSPSSLEVKSRQSVINEALLLLQNGLISPQAALGAIQGGIAENLWKGWINDVAQANKIIQLIKRGPDALFALPDRPPFPGEPPPVNPQTGQALLVGQDGQPKIPGYMPRPFDNAAVIKQVFETWMKTAEWDRLPAPSQYAGMIYYQAIVGLEQKNQIEAAQRQQQMAQGIGMANAAKPPGPKPLPSLPNLQTQGADNNGQ